MTDADFEILSADAQACADDEAVNRIGEEMAGAPSSAAEAAEREARDERNVGDRFE